MHKHQLCCVVPCITKTKYKQRKDNGVFNVQQIMVCSLCTLSDLCHQYHNEEYQPCASENAHNTSHSGTVDLHNITGTTLK